MKRDMVRVALAAALVAGAVGTASAYEAVDVTGGGSLTGTVKYGGTPPAPEKFAVTKDATVCGQEKTKPDLIVGSDGGIANVMVIVKASKGKKMDVPAEPVSFDQKGCEYHPHVLAVPAGSTIAVLNPDGILHNVHVMGKNNPEANRAMPKFQKKIDWKVEKPEMPIAVKCDAHPWMHAYWFVMDQPYYAVTDAAGKFSIADIPPGDYDVEVWHETLGQKTEKVTIPSGGAATVDWSLTKS